MSLVLSTVAHTFRSVIQFLALNRYHLKLHFFETMQPIDHGHSGFSSVFFRSRRGDQNRSSIRPRSKEGQNVSKDPHFRILTFLFELQCVGFLALFGCTEFFHSKKELTFDFLLFSVRKSPDLYPKAT